MIYPKNEKTNGNAQLFETNGVMVIVFPMRGLLIEYCLLYRCLRKEAFCDARHFLFLIIIFRIEIQFYNRVLVNYFGALDKYFGPISVIFGIYDYQFSQQTIIRQLVCYVYPRNSIQLVSYNLGCALISGWFLGLLLDKWLRVNIDT